MTATTRDLTWAIFDKGEWALSRPCTLTLPVAYVYRETEKHYRWEAGKWVGGQKDWSEDAEFVATATGNTDTVEEAQRAARRAVESP